MADFDILVFRDASEIRQLCPCLRQLLLPNQCHREYELQLPCIVETQDIHWLRAHYGSAFRTN